MFSAFPEYFKSKPFSLFSVAAYHHLDWRLETAVCENSNGSENSQGKKPTYILENNWIYEKIVSLRGVWDKKIWLRLLVFYPARRTSGGQELATRRPRQRFVLTSVPSVNNTLVRWRRRDNFVSRTVQRFDAVPWKYDNSIILKCLQCIYRTGVDDSVRSRRFSNGILWFANRPFSLHYRKLKIRPPNSFGTRIIIGKITTFFQWLFCR